MLSEHGEGRGGEGGVGEQGLVYVFFTLIRRRR